MRKNLLFCLLCILGTVNMYAESWTDGMGATWTFQIETSGSITGAQLTGLSNSDVVKDATVPGTVYVGSTAYPVTSIGSSAFCNCISLASIEDLSNCASIGNNAFENCTSLQNVSSG